MSKVDEAASAGGEGRGDELETERQIGSISATSERRLVLIGRTGSGKSASGNTILGRYHFLSELRASSVTQVCEQGSVELTEDDDEEDEGRKRLVVLDMPGFGDTRLDPGEIHAEIAKCVALMSPGPHVFLLVVPLGRYTVEEGQAAQEMVQIFGEGALHHHTMVLFTRGDDLEGRGIESYLGKTAPEELKTLLEKCGGRYHVLNNRDLGNRDQVRCLLEKVEQMVEENDGQCYTNTMFLQVEEAIREEQERLMKERGQGEGKEDGEEGKNDVAEINLPKRRKRDLEERWWSQGGPEGTSGGLGRRDLEGPPCEAVEKRELEIWRDERTSDSAWSLVQERGQRWRERWRVRRRGSGSRAVSRRQAFRSAMGRFRREAALSGKVLERVKVLVAAGATGMAVGAVFGAAAPLAMAAGATVMGNAVGFAAGQLAGASVAGGAGVGTALGAIVAAATGKTAVALGAATGGVLGGSVGALVGAEAASPGEAALDTLGQVGAMGATAVGAATGVGGAMGAGAVLGAVLEGTAVGAAALTATEAAGSVAGVTNATVAAASHTAAASGSAAAALQTVGGAVADGAVAGSQSIAATSGGLTGTLGTVGATARILTAVAEIGKAAAGIALAGGLVIKVVKEKVRTGTSTADNSYSEKKSYEIYWNK